MRPKWFPDWTGETIVVVASGPSAAAAPLGLGRGRARFIAINDSWRLCPWADILFAGDYKWWELHQGCPEFLGLRVSIDRRACEFSDWDICRLRGYRADQRISFDAGIVGGSNSGLNALNLAVQLVPSKVLLVGFDMRLDAGIHWHGLHPPETMKNPTENLVGKWRKAMDNAAAPIAATGIRVFNCSETSNLKRYPKLEFAEAIDA